MINAQEPSHENITNLGRYWPNVGPQVTLYVPGVVTGDLTYIRLFEFEGSSCFDESKCYVELIDHPIIDSL